MDNFVRDHLMGLYGLNPNILPYSFQFPRIPPGFNNPSFKAPSISVKEKFHQQNESLNVKLQDFQQTYQKYASGLFDTSSPTIIPPGHPLFSRHTSIEIIQAEKNKLQKENFELKNQLNKLTKEKQIN